VTFVDWEDIARWQMIDRALKLPFKDPIETYSTSDHVYTGLKIPPGTKGTLPKDKRTREGLAAEEVEDLGETGKKKTHARTHGDKHDKHDKHKHGDKKHHGKKHHDQAGHEHADAVARTEPDPEAAAKPKRRRARRRTRGGKPVGGGDSQS
jgi:hypothetical protein